MTIDLLMTPTIKNPIKLTATTTEIKQSKCECILCRCKDKDIVGPPYGASKINNPLCRVIVVIQHHLLIHKAIKRAVVIKPNKCVNQKKQITANKSYAIEHLHNQCSTDSM